MKNVLTVELTDPLNVLIVEDDPIHSFILETLLAKYWKVCSVNNGYAALEAIEKEKFDVILMDINLNDHTLDGIGTMRKIKYQRKHKDIKVIALTASSDAKEWFIKQGFDSHYMKPIAEKTIVEEINALARKESVRSLL
jgi:two-component system sensor histidine kinase BarA